MKRVYVHFYANGNFGDDLFVKILCNRYPHIKFIMGINPEYSNNFTTTSNLKIIKYNHIYRVLRKVLKIVFQCDILYKLSVRRCSAIVYIGGSIFIEPKDSMEKTINVHKENYIKSKPYFVLGANFGPFSKKEFYDFFHDEFKMYTDVCFRDLYSYRLFSDLHNIRYAPDIVFSTALESKYKNNCTAGNYIALSIIGNRKDIEEFDEKRFIVKVVDTVKTYIEKGFEIRFVALCPKQGDAKIIEQVLKRLDTNMRNKIQVVEYLGDTDEIISIIQNAKYVLAMRFHAIVIALANRVPVYPIAYSNKTVNMLKDIKFEGKQGDVNSFLESDFSVIDDNRNQYLWNDKENISQKALEHFIVLDKSLKDSIEK